MNWESLDAFLAMGGHGLYVWGSYAVTFALIAVEIVLLKSRRRHIMNELRQSTVLRKDLP